MGYELDHIQDLDDLTPQEKAGLYGQQLTRYRHYLEKARNEGQSLIPSLPPTPAPTAAGAGAVAERAAAAADAPPPAKTRDLNARVVEKVGKDMKKKAGLLLDH